MRPASFPMLIQEEKGHTGEGSGEKYYTPGNETRQTDC